MVAAGRCVTVVGLSNFGKSTLLRGLTTPQHVSEYKRLSGRDPLFVYVDCNRILEPTVQGFYEVILRAVLDVLPADAANVKDKVETLYRRVVEPIGSAIGVPLAFTDTVAQLMALPYDLVLLLDEFDDALKGLEPRLFLNMRAVKGRQQERLINVIAT